MPSILGSAIVFLVLAAVIFLAARSVWNSRKKGGCGGDCAHCCGCHTEQ